MLFELRQPHLNVLKQSFKLTQKVVHDELLIGVISYIFVDIKPEGFLYRTLAFCAPILLK